MLKKLKSLVLGSTPKPPEPTQNPIVHNYTTGVLEWGHEASYHPVQGTEGKIHKIHGFSKTPILVGDYILLSTPIMYGEEWHVRYRVTKIEFEDGVEDMFFGTIEFVERTEEQKIRDLAMVHQRRTKWLDTGSEK
jgi:hypothetical protein